MRIGSLQAPRRLVKKLALSAGYTLQRVPNPNRLSGATVSGTGGSVIEFIGASGVGKSTLCDALLSSCREVWFSKNDLNDLVLRDLDYPRDE